MEILMKQRTHIQQARLPQADLTPPKPWQQIMPLVKQTSSPSRLALEMQADVANMMRLEVSIGAIKLLDAHGWIIQSATVDGVERVLVAMEPHKFAATLETTLKLVLTKAVSMTG
eukprot:387788_1